MITNLADPQLRTMGLDADSVKAKHPKVIYARINGYGFRGPDKDAESFDLGAFWARSGILQGHAFGDVLPQPRPGVGDHATAISLVAGIILSLLIRERSGEINEARASLLDTAMWMNCLDIAAAGFFGKQPQRRQGGSIPMISAYETADERRIYLQVTHQPGWVEFCSAVGHPEWVGDERFAGLGRRLKYADDLRPLVTEVMKSKPLKEWETIFREKGIPTATINGAFDIHSDEQVAANGHLSKREVGGGSISVVTAPFEVGEPPEGGEAPAAPSHGENGELIMLELGYDWDQIAAFREKGVVGPA
ncbi:MAG TPA: CoA transferase, partial [Dehalococcoidia bacterium]|nr:CoA transferase [Dehalococcoidia bacterium]